MIAARARLKKAPARPPTLRWRQQTALPGVVACRIELGSNSFASIDSPTHVLRIEAAQLNRGISHEFAPWQALVCQLRRRRSRRSGDVVDAAPAQEQPSQDEHGLEEVTVTAQRREENLQNVPISISAFTAASIKDNMFDDVSDYLVKTPNASFISTGARSRREISIRGVTNFLAIDSALRTSTFGFYVDGFSVAGTSVNPPIMDIERIEVLRGPQATYFGRNAVGGGISITSNKPTNKLEGSVSADASRFDTYDLEGVLNVPIVDGKLAARFNAKYSTSDGNIKNINAARRRQRFGLQLLQGGAALYAERPADDRPDRHPRR